MHPHARQRAVHPASLSIDQLLKDCHVTRTRRSGPGGQHRNKVETAVVIVHRPTGVRAEASERRSQAENHSEAVFRLRVNLALQVRSISSPETEPSRLWQSRCRGSRVAVNSGHDAYPAILAEALDVVAACGMDIKTAAGSLGCTASQLVKLLQSETRAIAIVNLERQSLGLAKLR
jgi:hypothetical protein